jgi:hypothetical protein
MITLLRLFVWTREQELLPDRKKNNVVILLHGIRASALHWPNQLAPLIAEESDFMVLCPDYGYFTALRFAIPRLHRRPLRWFQDQYSNVLADNPSATFHFVGHSNGTYLLGQSMLAIKGMQFKRVFLGGGVLPAEFPWDDVDSGLKDRFEILINAFCHSDYVVGVLCSILRGMFRFDVRTAGFERFQSLACRQYTVEVGHGAAFDSRQDLIEIARFVTKGEIPEHAQEPLPIGRRRMSKICRILGWALLAVLLWFAFIGSRSPFPWIGFIVDACIVAAIVLFLHFF